MASPSATAREAPPSSRAAAPLPIQLGERAVQARRAHLRRQLVRSVVLVVGDAVAVLALTTLWQSYAHPFSEWRVGRAMSLLLDGGLQEALPLLFATLIALVGFGNYRLGDARRNPGALAGAALVAVGLNWWHVFWTEPSRSIVADGMLLAAGLAGILILGRLVIDVGARRWRSARGHVSRALLVGAPADVARARADGLFEVAGDFGIVGALPLEGRGAETLGPDLGAEIVALDIDTVIVCGDISEEQLLESLNIADQSGCRVLATPTVCAMGPYEPTLTWRSGIPAVELTRPALQLPQLILKRGFDLTLSVLALLVLGIPLAIVALVVRLTSPGPVFFSQERIGAGGKPFRIWKFRTMVAASESQVDALRDRSLYADPRLFKVPNDPRVTPVGRWLRRSSVDELPQLWNVLRGDMSLVGPRPPLPEEVALYAEHHYTRFDFRPGITGPWQVNGRNRITDFEEVLRLEIAYMRRWTIWKDFAILLRTIPVVLRMDGAH